MSNLRKGLTTTAAAIVVIAASNGAAEAKKKPLWKKVVAVAVPGSAVLLESKPLSAAGVAAAVTPAIAPPAVHTAVEKGASDLGTAVETAAHDTGKAVEKGLHDTGKTIETAVHDGGKAVVATGKLIEREVAAHFDAYEAAFDRIAQGKIVDAAWHFGTDHAKATEKNAFKATQESNVIRIGGQIAATVYGGPGGAAAFAAWQAYKLSGGNLEAAIKAGVISGATSYLSGANAGMASETTKEIAKKVVIAGAIAGAAVAASGGSQADIQNAFVIGAATAGVQVGYEKVLGKPLDREALKASKGEAYCLGAPTMNSCTGEPSAYRLLSAENGDPVMRAKNEPYLDVRRTDWRRPHVGKWATTNDSPWIGLSERSANMIAVSKYPGMNAMAMFHDHVSYALRFDEFTNVVTIVPATVFTYYGTESPIMEAIRKAGERKLETDEAKGEPTKEPT